MPYQFWLLYLLFISETCTWYMYMYIVALQVDMLSINFSRSSSKARRQNSWVRSVTRRTFDSFNVYFLSSLIYYSLLPCNVSSCKTLHWELARAHKAQGPCNWPASTLYMHMYISVLHSFWVKRGGSTVFFMCGKFLKNLGGILFLFKMFYYWSLMDSRCLFMAYGVILKHLVVDKITKKKGRWWPFRRESGVRGTLFVTGVENTDTCTCICTYLCIMNPQLRYFRFI
jgi:hypothetical protein